VPIVTRPEGGDPAAIVFDAVKQATDTGIDALIVDTAGRLQNKRELMDELAKIRRVLGRLNPKRRTMWCWCSMPPTARMRCPDRRVQGSGRA
jgi:signal recognition particle GTPase